MSLRQRVDRTRITVFLQRLGERFRHPARVYLVGGATMVFAALRPQTLDIDVVLEVSADAHSDLIQAICELKEALKEFPQSAELYRYRGDLRVQKKTYKAAIAILHQDDRDPPRPAMELRASRQSLAEVRR